MSCFWIPTTSLYDNQSLSKLVDCIQDNVIPFGAFVCTESFGVPLAIASRDIVDFSRENGDVPKTLALANLKYGPRCALMKRDFILGVGGYIRPAFEDLDIVISLLLAGYCFHGISEVISVYLCGARGDRLSAINADLAVRTYKVMKN